jgi:hypothetical protein
LSITPRVTLTQEKKFGGLGLYIPGMILCYVEEKREEKNESEIIKSEIKLVHATNHPTIITTTTNHLTTVTTTINYLTAITAITTLTTHTTTTHTTTTHTTTTTSSLLLRNVIARPMRIVVCSLQEHILQTVR